MLRQQYVERRRPKDDGRIGLAVREGLGAWATRALASEARATAADNVTSPC